MPGLQLRRRVPPRSTGPAPSAHLEDVVMPTDPRPVDWVMIVFAVVFIALVIFGVLYVRV